MLNVMELLQYPALAGASIVTGSVRQLMRQVHGVVILDDVSSVLNCSDTFALISANAGDGDHISTCIQFAAQADAVAVGVCLAPAALPAARVAAEQAQLPLIALPAWISLAELETYLTEHLGQASTVALPTAQLWLQYVLQGVDLPTFVYALAAHWKRSLAILDQAGQIVAHAGPDGCEVATCLMQWRQAHSEDGLPLLLAEHRLFGEPLPGGGHFAVQYRGEAPSPQERHMVKDILGAVEIALQRHVALQERNERQREEYIWDLLMGRISDELTALIRGRQIGFDIRAPYSIVVGKLEPESPEESEQKVLTIALQVAAEHQITVLEASVSRYLVFIVSLPESKGGADEFVDDIRRALSRAETVSCQITWGVSDPSVGLADCPAQYRHALTLCQMGRMLNGSGSVNVMAHLGVYPLLRKLCADPESQRFWQRYLDKILQLEHQKSGDLLRTLEVYLALQGNISEAARQLYLHRQTMNYRLQRIMELTHCDLTNPQDRFALELSLHLYHLQTLEKIDTNDKVPAIF